MSPDVGTGLEAAAGAATLKTFLGPLAEKVLGPIADDIGRELQQWRQGRRDRLRRVVEHGAGFLPPGAEDDGRNVPMRVLEAIMDDGTLSDEKVVLSYFGGLLASSKTGHERDDRAAVLSALIRRLSTYEVRTHYLVYAHARRCMMGSEINWGLERERQGHARIALPIHLWVDALQLEEEVKEGEELAGLLSETLHGLIREGLLDAPFAFGPAEALQPLGFRGVDLGSALAVQLSPLGVRLYCWGHGQRSSSLSQFLEPSAAFPTPADLPPLGDGAMSLGQARTIRAAQPRPPIEIRASKRS